MLLLLAVVVVVLFDPWYWAGGWRRWLLPLYLPEELLEL